MIFLENYDLNDNFKIKPYWLNSSETYNDFDFKFLSYDADILSPHNVKISGQKLEPFTGESPFTILQGLQLKIRRYLFNESVPIKW